jgi:membrane protein YqaA with SNARE-associated domain
VRSLSAWIIGHVASPIGIVILAALDSTLLFSAPGGIDAAVLLLAARHGTPPWAVALFATAGSVAGAALTFWMGVKIGEHGLERHIPRRRLARIRRKVHSAGALGMAVLDLIPPPFPFTPFILAAGALEVDATTFFGTLTACRLLRFGGEALLARAYGSQILTWLDSDLFQGVVVGCSVLAIVLTMLSLAKILSSTRRAAAAR